MIKQLTLDALQRYVEHGIPTGSFLRGVLENNLIGAASHADKENLLALGEIALYCLQNLPSSCWGSYDACEDWKEKKRKEREG